MSQRLAQVRSRFKTSEKIGRTQLVLVVDALHRGEGERQFDDAESDGPVELADADASLRTASGIDDAQAEGDLEKLTTRLPRPPEICTPAPAHLRRVDSPRLVPADRRACPTCGTERTCIGHDVTEVIELIPAQVIVRHDRREKLACAACEAEVVRAPIGDKVVASGEIGLGLAATLLVEKYADGLPLHRQRERLARLGVDIAVSTLTDQIKWCADLLRPLWRAAVAEVVAGQVMHLDGRGLMVLDPNPPNNKASALWGYVGGNAGEVIAAYLDIVERQGQGAAAGEIGPQDMLDLRDVLERQARVTFAWRSDRKTCSTCARD